MQVRMRSRLHRPTTSTTTYLCSHPVRRRPTHRGAGVVQGVQVERATVRTTWTPWAASARLCLGQRWSGWEHPAHATTDPRSATAPPPSRCRPGRMPSSAESEGLSILPGTPVIEICRTAYTADGRPVELNQMLLDAGAYALRYTFGS
ncbi:UTRA domain-containing protein [Streptomyces sp. SLBN-31]|uniref:UTRA domain-containing protein n=1 Tax=Streptomyces sp. SLBN-31 TaxID=2768444 RepID=UPI001153110A|nr:UTRA domain-containing protein [Streptomyces sp. SLBN-31]